MNFGRHGLTGLGSVGNWLFGAFACVGIAIVSLVAVFVTAQGAAMTGRLYALAAVFMAGALLCALVAATRRLSELVEATSALKAAQENTARARRAAPEHDPEMLLEAQLSGTLITEFADNELSQHSERLASALEMATRGIGAHNEAMRAHLQEAVDATAAAMSVQTQSFSDRLGEERSKVSEALDLYGESIASRLNLASIALAREFRDSAEQLRKEMEASGDAASFALAQRGEAIAATLKASADEIERGLIERSREFVAGVEAAHRSTAQALTLESDAALQRLASETGTLADEVEAALRKHIEAASESRSSLLAALGDGGAGLAERALSAANALEKSVTNAEEAIGRRVEDALGQIGAKIDARVEELAHRLTSVELEVEQRWADRRGQLEVDIARESEALRSAIVLGAKEATRTAAQDVVLLAKSSAELLKSAAEQVAAAVAASNTTLTDKVASVESTLNGRGAALAEQLESQSKGLRAALEQVETLLSERSGGFVDAIERTSRTLDEAMQAHARALSDRTEADHSRFATLADQHGASVTQALNAHHEAIERAFAAASADLAAKAELRESDTVGKLQATAQSFVDGLIDRMQALNDALGSRGDALRSQFLARQTELVDIIGAGLSQTDARARERLNAISEALEALASRIDSGLESRGRALAQTLARATLEITQGLSNSSQELRSAIDAGAGEAVRALANQGAATREALEGGAREAARILDTGRENFASSLATSAKDAVESLTSRGREAREALSAETADAVARIEASRSALVGASAEAAERLVEALQSHHEKLAQTASNSVERLNRDFGAPLNETIARIETEGAELAAATRALAESIAKTGAIHRDSLKQGFEREAEALAATLAANAETFRRDFQAALAGADDTFLGRGLELAGALANRIGELRVLLENDGRAFIEGFESKSTQLSSQVESVSLRSLSDFERKTTGLIALLTRRGDDLLSAMTAAASESARRVADLSGEVDGSAERTAASLRQIERKFTALLSMIDKRGDDLTAMVGHRLAPPRADNAAPQLEPPRAAEPPLEAPQADEEPARRSA